jgi:ligand-binding sensor domain-containing protein/signal transduction histidine kinase
MGTNSFLKIITVSAMATLIQGLGQVSAQDQVTPGTMVLPVVSGKDIRFTAFTGEEGLSSSNVFAMAQDDQGLLWFATTDGLSRYDGYSFRVFRFEHGNPNSLSNNSMTDIIPGKGGILWLATTDGGVDRFDPATETFTHYRHDPDNPNSLSGNSIPRYGLCEDQQGALWIGTIDKGLDRLDPVSGNFTHYSHDPDNPNSLSSNNIECIYQDSEGMLWIGTSNAGLNRLDPVSGQITRYLPNPNDPYALPNVYVRGIYEDRTGTFWIGTGKGFASLDRRTGRFSHYTIAPIQPDAASLNSISLFFEDEAGNLWLGTNGAGALKFDRKRQQVVQYKNDSDNPHSLRNNFISSFLEEPSGTMWLGTLGSGANVFSTRPPKFAHYKHMADNTNSLAENFILSIFEDHTGIVWIGNDRTLNRWDRRSNTWQVYRNDPTNPASISNGSVTATQEDPDGTLWFGTFLGGLNRFDPKTGKFKAYRFNPKDLHSLGDDIIRSLYIDSKGLLWVGGWNNGLSRFDRVTETFQRYQNDPGNPASLGKGSITDIYEDKANTLWVATEGGGLNRFDPTTGKFIRYQNDPQKLKSLPDNIVRVLCEDQSEQFWVGTNSGLCNFDRATGTCTVYTEKEGLPNNTIQGILEDEEGNLWISTNNGLSRFNPRTKTFRNYDVIDGLQSNEFYVFNAFCKSPHTEEMYFGGINGFNVFNPSQVKDNPYVPPIALTDFRLFGKSVPVGESSVLKKTINKTDSLTLAYDQNSLSFEFVALSYVAPTKNQYRYKLEGFDTDWHDVGSKERLAVYTNISAGNYIFKVQGTNEDGIWNKKGKTIFITILTPWWRTWWFRGISVTLLVGIVIIGFRLRIRNIKNRSRKFERLVEERTDQLQAVNDELETTNEELATTNESLHTVNKELESFSYSVSHDLRAPLRSIDGFSQILLEEYQNKLLDKQGQDYLHRVRGGVQKMTQLVEDMLKLSKVSGGELTIRRVNLSNIVKEITNDLRNSNPDRNVEFVIQDEITADADERLIQSVLENLIGNAWKYTSKRPSAHIEFGMQQQNGKPVFFVRDNGAGFEMKYAQKLFGAFQRLHDAKEFQGTGVGLATVQRIIHRHGGEVWAEGEVEKGATFYFTLA